MNTAEKKSSAKPAKFKRRDIDLLEALRCAEREQVKKKKSGRPGGLVYIIAAAVVLAAGAGYASAALRYSQLSDENDGLLADISLAKIQMSDATQLSLKLDWLNDLEAETSSQIAALEESGTQYDYLTSDLFTRIRRQFPSGVSIDSIEMNDGTFTLSLKAGKAGDAAELVKRLRSEEIFKWIEYGGFTADEQSSETMFTITCGLTDKPAEEVK